MAGALLESAPCAFAQDRDILLWCAGMVAQTPTGRALLSEASASGWSLALGDLGGQGGLHLDIPSRLLVLDPYGLNAQAFGRTAHYRQDLCLMFARGLREIWHENRMGAPEPVYKPESVLTLERARAADIDTIALLCAWEMRAAGYADAWRHVLGSEQGDMAMIFTRRMEKDPSALFTGMALTQAFRQWYADDDRVNLVDRETLRMMDTHIATAPAHPLFGQKSCDADVIHALATLPDGVAYLKDTAEAVLRDPFFCGMSDPINQTHLFQIVYDMEAVVVCNVPFRDARLARKIFPDAQLARM